MDKTKAKDDLAHLDGTCAEGKACHAYADGYYAKSLEKKYGMSVDELRKALKQ